MNISNDVNRVPVSSKYVTIQATADVINDETDDDKPNVAAGNTEAATEDIIEDVVGPVLDEYHHKYYTNKKKPLSATSSILLPHMNDIVQAFTIDSSTTMESIMDKLDDMQPTSIFAQQISTVLHKMSPTSLKLTLMGLQRNLLSLPETEKPTFYEELQYEYRIAQHCMKQNENTKSDFYEGIRATLIDKDYTPKWSPTTLQDVTDESIRTNYIKQLIPKEWELPHEYNLHATLLLNHDTSEEGTDNDRTTSTTIDSKL